ncbi:hypothetical protein [Pseudophaeobacter flagellatus]|uniref:hypothetical protein n=1 Tax=Pseudophaeobacter flagellatus TaxID=2899119 RepID=UPI001E3324DC|nr:hypothetical protein [Pseudophaeobacter flagellatus]MCD9148525.1 hypothetical protein [Pseudophaeobacter flagellatus]
MHITFICSAGLPGQPETTASVAGDTLTVDGVGYDLSAVPEGGFAEPGGDHPFAGRIARSGGTLTLSLHWRYDAATAQAHQPAASPVLTVAAGAVPDPIIRKPVELEA